MPADQIAIPAVVIAELQTGAELTRRQDSIKTAELERWIEHLMLTFKIVPMGGAIFREWARVMVGKPDELFEDAMIVATARIHGLIVVTRNMKDFEKFDVELFNPFAPAQAAQE